MGGQGSLFGIVDGDAAMFDATVFEVPRPVVGGHRAPAGLSLAEQTAAAQTVHDLWRDRLLEVAADPQRWGAT